jgi:hypothetical protein
MGMDVKDHDSISNESRVTGVSPIEIARRDVRVAGEQVTLVQKDLEIARAAYRSARYRLRELEEKSK